MATQKISRALVSVFYKDGLEPLVRALHHFGIEIISTGGTQGFIEGLGIPVTSVESITGFPEVFGGRVKTLHPIIFGGILQRRDLEGDRNQAAEHQIKPIDLVVVDLYPFEETVAKGGTEAEIIEKIDIGGISLIRAAAKNFKDVAIVSNVLQYAKVTDWIQEGEGGMNLAQRKLLAAEAFDTSSHYDTLIFRYFNREFDLPVFKASYQEKQSKVLRYGENPHQKGAYFGDLDAMFKQLNGKELSYNNLVDVEAALDLLDEFNPADGSTCVIVKHTNACGVAMAESPEQAYQMALEADPTSAFGGVIAFNTTITLPVAEKLNELFFEILSAPDYEPAALELLKSKKNRMLMQRLSHKKHNHQYKSLLNGVLVQEKDLKTESAAEATVVTTRQPTTEELAAADFAIKVCKHTKSNTIVLAKGKQLIASGTGQTSRIDASQQAFAKARKFFGSNLSGVVLASDAFFPFADNVELAYNNGIEVIVQPGGSVKDKDSISFADSHQMCMLFTGTRHFKH